MNQWSEASEKSKHKTSFKAWEWVWVKLMLLQTEATLCEWTLVFLQLGEFSSWTSNWEFAQQTHTNRLTRCPALPFAVLFQIGLCKRLSVYISRSLCRGRGKRGSKEGRKTLCSLLRQCGYTYFILPAQANKQIVWRSSKSARLSNSLGDISAYLDDSNAQLCLRDTKKLWKQIRVSNWANQLNCLFIYINLIIIITFFKKSHNLNWKLKMFRSIACCLFIVALAITSSEAQFRPPSIIGITHIVRYQNTACSNADQESGTCLADAECSRRAGTNIGTCANGYGTCCSFKVCINQLN